MRRLLTLVLAALAALAMTAGVAGAQPSTQQSDVDIRIDLGEVLDVLTYRIHTVFVAPNGTVIDRTVPAVVGVPALVNVNGFLLPDLTVEILPLPPNLITVSFLRLPTAPARMPLLAEVLVDVPGGVGARFGFDTRSGGNMPPAFNTNLAFGLGGGGTTIDLFANTAFPSTTPTLAVVGEVFTKGAGGAKVDPTGARVDLTPVPGSLHVALDTNGDDVRPALDVAVETGVPTTATIAASTVDGPTQRTVSGVIDQLPDTVTVGVRGDLGDPDTKADDRQDVTYRASQPIRHVEADVIERENGVIQSHIDAVLDDVPATIDVGVVGTRATLSAGAPIGTARLGVNAAEDSPLPAPEDTPAEPVFVLAELDSLADPDDPLRRAAIRVPGVRSFEVDTADPLVVDIVSAGGPLRAIVTDTRTGGEFRVNALADALPADARVEFSSSLGTLAYDAQQPITLLTALVDEPDGFISPGLGGAAPNHLDLRVEQIPGAMTLAFGSGDGDRDDDGNPDPVVDTDGDGDLTDEGANLLARFDARGSQIGAITAVLTSGPALPSEPLVTDSRTGELIEDGLVVEDVAGRFVVQAHVTGLRSVELVRGGPEEDRPGSAAAVPIAELDVDAVGHPNGFRGKLIRTGPDGNDRVEAFLSKLAPGIGIDLFQFVGDIPCTGGPGNLQCLPDTDGDGFVDALPCTVFGGVDGCRAFGLDQDFNGIIDVGCQDLFLIAEDDQCVALDPDQNGLIDDANLGVQAAYASAGAISGDDLTVRADVGERTQPVFLQLVDLPTRADLCFSRNEACTTFPDTDRDGIVVDFDADAPFTVNAIVCLKDAGKVCEQGDRKDALLISGLRVQALNFELDSAESEPVQVFADTKGTAVTGTLLLDKGPLSVNADLGDRDNDGDSGVNVSFDSLLANVDLDLAPLPDGLTVNRWSVVVNSVLNVDIDGGVVCPPGFQATLAGRILVLPVNILLTEAICE